jgi:hypothetical protein
LDIQAGPVRSGRKKRKKKERKEKRKKNEFPLSPGACAPLSALPCGKLGRERLKDRLEAAPQKTLKSATKC